MFCLAGKAVNAESALRVNFADANQTPNFSLSLLSFSRPPLLQSTRFCRPCTPFSLVAAAAAGSLPLSPALTCLHQRFGGPRVDLLLRLSPNCALRLRPQDNSRPTRAPQPAT